MGKDFIVDDDLPTHLAEFGMIEWKDFYVSAETLEGLLKSSTETSLKNEIVLSEIARIEAFIESTGDRILVKWASAKH